MKSRIDNLEMRSGISTKVTPVTSDGVYQEGLEYEVTIDRMMSGKVCMYFNSGHKEGAGQSYRVFQDAEELTTKFKGV
jgi:hypothetical protein